MGRRISLLSVINAMERAGRQAAREAERQRKANERAYYQQQRLAYLDKIEQCKEAAEQETIDAQKKIEELENLLLNSIGEKYLVDWNKQKDTSKFVGSKPICKELQLPDEPSRNSKKYKLGLLLSIGLFFCIKEYKQEKLKEKDDLFKKDLDEWKQQTAFIKKQQKKFDKDFKTQLEQWNATKADFYNKQKEHNRQIDENKSKYTIGDEISVKQYYDLIFEQIVSPDCFDNEFEVSYNAKNKMLLMNCYLPTIEDLPNIKDVKFIKASHEFKTTLLPQTYLKKLYDSVIYQYLFRIMNIIFTHDDANVVDTVVLNGTVSTVDTSTGKDINACIVSVQINKNEFNELCLDKIDAKQAFKRLKGISCSQLEIVTPITPILQIDRTDKRFIEAHNVINNVNEGTNLASMEWQDFENLIREIFEFEFGANGGECKITQASRDGGVDAIAFDPDPIRGGKIVIQAKRYTNTVSVSAVRDLYGTVMNEGATKGILVTTSDYGADAYHFAKGKPITLLNGANLLHLLDKYGQKAYINIKEAKIKQ